MKYLFIPLLLLSACASNPPAGAKAPMPSPVAKEEIPEVIAITGSKTMATVNAKTGDVSYDKDVKPEDVIRVLIGTVKQAQKDLNDCRTPKKK